MKKKIDMSSQPQPTRGGPPIVTSPLIEVRNSPVHGRGVFAVAHIPKGTRILEYLGDRVSHAAKLTTRPAVPTSTTRLLRRLRITSPPGSAWS